MNSKMKMLLTSVSPAALALAGSANAADLPRKAPPAVMPVAAPAYSWTGCYVGAHAGYGWGKNDPARNSFFFSSGGGPLSQTLLSGRNGIDLHGGVFGGQVGCQYQFATNWVFGVEAMFAGTDIKGNASDPFFSGKLTTGTDLINVKTDWITSATARLGFTTWNNVALWYLKGGVAGVRDKWTIGSGIFGGFSQDRIGWTVGGGLEWAWTPQWSTFVDFSYYDFRNSGNTLTNQTFLGFLTGITDTFSPGKQQIEILKVGVNYKFIP